MCGIVVIRLVWFRMNGRFMKCGVLSIVWCCMCCFVRYFLSIFWLWFLVCIIVCLYVRNCLIVNGGVCLNG